MQWRAVVGIVFALVIAVFAVINVNDASIHYLFGVAHVPLVLVIIGSALFGALAVATLGFVSRLKLVQENRRLHAELARATHGAQNDELPVDEDVREGAPRSFDGNATDGTADV